MFDLGGFTDFLKNATKQVADVAGTIADAQFGWQSRSLDLAKQRTELAAANNQLTIQRTVSDAQVEIAKLQAKNALQQAQTGYGGIDSLNADNINQAIANLQSRIIGGSSNNSWMLWLTVAGVGFAALQYFKGKH